MFDVQLGNSPAEQVVNAAVNNEQFMSLFNNDKDKFSRFVVSFRQYMYQTPDLVKIYNTEAGKIALIMAVREAAAADLSIDKKQSAIVIFNQKQKDAFGKDIMVNGKPVWENVPKFFPMVYGIRKLALERAGILLHSDIVHKNDYFDYVSGDNEHLDHKPNVFGDRGEPIGAYVIVKKGNEILWRTLMSKEDIEKRRAKSKTYTKAVENKTQDTTIWSEWWKEMWIKTVIHRLKNEFPLIEKLGDILDRDSFDYEDAQYTVMDLPPQQTGYQPKTMESLLPPNDDTKIPNDLTQEPAKEKVKTKNTKAAKPTEHAPAETSNQADDGWGDFQQ